MGICTLGRGLIRVPGEQESNGGGGVGVRVPEAGAAAGNDVIVVAGQLQGAVAPHRQRQRAFLRVLRNDDFYRYYLF